ncbi:MAG: hypothetical protein ACO1QR_09485 [Chthoniobacteraceae bacterium]
MPSCGGAFHHEPIHSAAGFAGEIHGQGRGRNDREKLRTQHGGDIAAAEFHRIEGADVFLLRECAFHIQLHLDRLPLCEAVEDSRDGPRNARTHEHVIHSGEHRSKERRQRRQLDLLEEIDPHHAEVTGPCEKHFHEIGHDREFDQPTRWL